MSKIEKAQKTAYKNYSNGYKAGREAERLRNKRIIDRLIEQWNKHETICPLTGKDVEYCNNKNISCVVCQFEELKKRLEKEPEKKVEK